MDTACEKVHEQYLPFNAHRLGLADRNEEKEFKKVVHNLESGEKENNRG